MSDNMPKTGGESTKRLRKRRRTKRNKHRSKTGNHPERFRRYVPGVDPVQCTPALEHVVFDPTPDEVRELVTASGLGLWLELKGVDMSPTGKALNWRSWLLEQFSRGNPRVPQGYQLSPSGLGLYLYLNIGWRELRYRTLFNDRAILDLFDEKPRDQIMPGCIRFGNSSFLPRDDLDTQAMVTGFCMKKSNNIYWCLDKNEFALVYDHEDKKTEYVMKVTLKTLKYVPRQILRLGNGWFVEKREFRDFPNLQRPTEATYEALRSHLRLASTVKNMKERDRGGLYIKLPAPSTIEAAKGPYEALFGSETILGTNDRMTESDSASLGGVFDENTPSEPDSAAETPYVSKISDSDSDSETDEEDEFNCFRLGLQHYPGRIVG